MTVVFDLRSQLLQIMRNPPQKQPANGSAAKAWPRVSVIIPAHNVAPYIAATLASVLAQTFADYEIIVINDGSTDNLEAVLAPYQNRICYLKQENLGAGPARNAGILQARGELIAFLDGDDLWQPDFLASQVAFLEQNNYDLAYTDAEMFGEPAWAGRTYMQDAPSDGVADFKALLEFRCNVITSGTVARKQALLDVGLFEAENLRGQDFDLWLRLAHSGARLGYQKKVLLKYRVRLGSHSGDTLQRFERSLTRLRRIADKLPLNDEEQQIIQAQIANSEANLALERGKLLLLQEDFAAARAAFTQANAHRQSWRLSAIIWLLRLAPRLLLSVYRAQRADDIRFMPKAGI